jgi:hypothetical protein
MSFLHGYKAWNFAMPTTAAPTPVTTGTAIKTMLQIAPTRLIELVGWGYSFDDLPGADSIVELLTTGTVFATVTAHSSTGLIKMGNPATDASQVTLGVSATGFTATAEGSITATRSFDLRTISNSETSAAPYFSYEKYFLPGEYQVAAGDALRIRATTPSSATTMLCWAAWLE